MVDLTKVTNKLGLVKDASEDSIMNAINAIENKAKASEDAKAKAEKDKADAEAKLKEASDALDKFKADKEASDKEAKDAAEAKNEADVKDAINGYVKIGKIKNEATAIAAMTTTAKKVGLPDFKNIMDAAPIVAKAPKIVDAANELPKGVVKTTAANYSARVMANVNNRHKTGK